MGAGAVCLLALAGLFIETALVVRSLPALVADQADKAREALAIEVAKTRLETLLLVDKHLEQAEGRLEDTNAILDADMGRVADSVGQSLGEFSQSLQDAVARTESKVPDAQSTLDDLDRTVKDLDAMVRDIHPQALGLVAAAKVATGETAQTARVVQRAMPAIIETVNQVGENSRQATQKDIDLHEEAIAAVRNIKEDTRPRNVFVKLAVTAAVSALHVFF